MALDKYKLGWSTGGKIVLGTNPYYAGKYTDGSPYSETDGVSDLLTIDALMTAGEVSRSRTPVVEAMASIGAIDDQESRVKVLIADGVQIVNGSIGFSCDRSYMQSLLEYFFTKRKRSLTLYIGTENFSYVKVPSCKWSSVSITASEGGLLECSISVVSNVDFDEEYPESSQFDELYKDYDLIPYWQTGALNGTDILQVTSWSLTINQAVTPAYLNNADYDLPGYFRIGNWDFQLSVQMLTELKDYDRIQIGVTDTLNPIILSAQEYINMNATVSFGGIEAMGGYAVNLELVGIPDSYTDSASTSEPFSLTFS
jgi:hypothetical protein